MGFANPDFLTFTPKSFAGVEKPSVGKLSGAVGTVDDGGVAFRPGNSAVGGANHPLPEFVFALCFGETCVSGEPMRFVAVFWQARDVGEGGEGCDEEGALCCFENSGVPVIDGAVKNCSRVGPRVAVVMGSLEVDPPEGADVLFATAGADDEELSVLATGDGGPTVVVVWNLADNFCVEDLSDGSSLESEIKPQRTSDSGGGARFEEASARVIHRKRMSFGWAGCRR